MLGRLYVNELVFSRRIYLSLCQKPTQDISLLRIFQLRIIIIMYIYHALINALSAHMIYINLNMIFYTHV